MHDPMTVAHEIYMGAKKKKNGHYKSPLITIWHVDPEKDGTDDSCGWFKRKRHLNKELYQKVLSDFEFEFKHNTWFNEGGYPNFSVMGVTLCMYSRAAWTYFIWKNNGNPSGKANRKYKAFMNKYLFEFLHFAENSIDSLHDSIFMKYGVEKKEDRIEHFTSIVLADIIRKDTKWWQHPRWHIHHWKIQLHPLQNLKRRYWAKCCICGKRGFKGSAMGDWDGTKLWHQECDRTQKNPSL